MRYRNLRKVTPCRSTLVLATLSATVGLIIPAEWAGTASAQLSTPRAPLLYVQLHAPAGYSVTFLSRQQATTASKTPATVGLKPGYGYWVRLQPPPDQGEPLYLLLEVLDSLPLRAPAKAWHLPVPVAITELDLVRLREGEMVTKVIAVEYDLSQARDATELKELSGVIEEENEVVPPQDLFEYASRFGQPLLIARLGNRQLQPHEWTQPPVPITAGSFGLARQMREKAGQLTSRAGYIRDGGDLGQPAHRSPEGRLGGLEPGDAVAEFADSSGRRKLAAANPVYLFAPRFLTFYQRQGLARVHAGLKLQPVVSPSNQQVAAQTQGLQTARERAELQGLQSRTALQANRHSLPALRLIASHELAATRLEEPGPRAVSVPLTTESVTHFHCDPWRDPHSQALQLTKWASHAAARSGDVVTFYLRYRNTSSRPVHDIAIADTLSPRLEYVPGSARSDREAIFVVQENELGSRTLRWEIRDPLPPGAQGIVSFQARVR